MSRRYGRYRSRYGSYWPEYVPVAERRARAAKQLDRLKAKGEDIQPVTIEGRAIARTFWGKGWCAHLESFSDYDNRLPRGRTYVRNGSVCHLAIERGRVAAKVAGSSMYTVKVEIVPLPPKKWAALKKRCAGRIGSLIELLQGRLSDEIMSAVTHREEGLFPLPGEIKYICDCPDWADMCKHVSAVMYGIGARLDEKPELLFLLRQVDHGELIGGAADAAALAAPGARRTRRRALADADLSAVFEVDLEAAPMPADPAPAAPAPCTRAAKSTKAARAGGAVKSIKPVRKAAKARTAKSPAPAAAPPRVRSARTTRRAPTPFLPTADAVKNLRARLGMSRTAFARAAGVSTACISVWERSPGALRPQARTLAALQALHAKAQSSSTSSAP
jgi:uncharacterized Zn finger protein/DNA-binding transcriptional regulator YiaG